MPGAKLRVIRNNNLMEENLDDMNLFPLDLSYTINLKRSN